MNRIHEGALRDSVWLLYFYFHWTYGKINTIHEWALRIVCDDQTSTFNELLVR